MDDGAHSTSIMRSGSARRESTLWQLAWWTETPAPRVTNPMISSPGTGVQHLASFTRMSGAPRTSTPESLLRETRERCVTAKTSSASPPLSPWIDDSTFSITDWVETCPSPTAA